MKPITPEEYLDNDYFSPEIINMAETFIKEINIILNNYKYNDSKILEFNIYLDSKSLEFKKYIDSNTYTCTDYNGLKSAVAEYIVLKFKEAGWVISRIGSFGFSFNIQHPKVVTFK